MKQKILFIRILIIAGGLLLIAGAVLPWAIVTNDDNSFYGPSRTFTGLEKDAILSPLGGLVLVLIGIFRKGKPGKSFSIFGVIVSILCGLLLVCANYSYTILAFAVVEGGEHLALGFGLTHLSPLGALLGLIGSLIKTSVGPAPAVVMSTPVPSTGTEASKRQDDTQ